MTEVSGFIPRCYITDSGFSHNFYFALYLDNYIFAIFPFTQYLFNLFFKNYFDN